MRNSRWLGGLRQLHRLMVRTSVPVGMAAKRRGRLSRYKESACWWLCAGALADSPLYIRHFKSLAQLVFPEPYATRFLHHASLTFHCVNKYLVATFLPLSAKPQILFKLSLYYTNRIQCLKLCLLSKLMQSTLSDRRLPMPETYHS